MKLTFSARHFEPTEKLQEFAIKEVNKIRKYMSGDITGDVILEESRNRKIVDIRLNAMGMVFRSRLEDNDFYKIIPRAVDKLEKQLKVRKSKVYNR